MIEEFYSLQRPFETNFKNCTPVTLNVPNEPISLSVDYSSSIKKINTYDFKVLVHDLKVILFLLNIILRESVYSNFVTNLNVHLLALKLLKLLNQRFLNSVTLI